MFLIIIDTLAHFRYYLSTLSLKMHLNTCRAQLVIYLIFKTLYVIPIAS